MNSQNINFPPPSQFTQQLETLRSQLPHILDEFKKYYVFYNKNPEYPEYQQMFQNIKGNLNVINSKLFKLTNDVQFNTDELNAKLFSLDSLIGKERETNNELKRKLGIVEHKNNAATELISNYKDIYDSGYLRNWALFLSILVVGASISNIYKNKQ